MSAIKSGTVGTFTLGDWMAEELSDELDTSVETLENLEGQEIIIGCQAYDSYYDILFKHVLDNEGEQRLRLSAVSKYHFKELHNPLIDAITKRVGELDQLPPCEKNDLIHDLLAIIS